MKSEVVDSNGLLLVAKEKELVNKLVAQVEKDFGLANISLRLSETFEANAFVSSIRERVYHLMVEQFNCARTLLNLGKKCFMTHCIYKLFFYRVLVV